MAKYCIHCGRKLKDGEVCTCQANVSVQTDDMGSNLIDVFKGIFTKPIDTIKKYTDEKNFALSLLLVLVLAVSGALFVISLINNVSSMITSAMGGISMFYSSAPIMSDIPYLKIFFISLIMIVAFAFIFVALLYIVNSVIFNGEKNFKKIFSMYGVNTIITSITLLLSAIFMFVHVILGLALLALGSILNMVYVYKGIEYLGVKDENKYGYIYLITTLFYFIAIFIISLIFS